jgi:hypothetical protein
MSGQDTEGFVVSRNLKRRFLFFQDCSGAIHFCHENDMDFPLGHRCMVQIGDSVKFQLSTDLSGRPRAINARLLDPPELPQPENSTITHWKGFFGFAARDCPLACPVFVPRACIVTEGEEILQPGHRIRHRTVPGKDAKSDTHYSAEEIEIYIP